MEDILKCACIGHFHLLTEAIELLVQSNKTVTSSVYIITELSFYFWVKHLEFKNGLILNNYSLLTAVVIGLYQWVCKEAHLCTESDWEPYMLSCTNYPQMTWIFPHFAGTWKTLYQIYFMSQSLLDVKNKIKHHWIRLNYHLQARSATIK